MPIRYIQRGERLMGENDIGQPDIINRPIKDVISGINDGTIPTRSKEISTSAPMETAPTADLTPAFLVEDGDVFKSVTYTTASHDIHKDAPIGIYNKALELLITEGVVGGFTDLEVSKKYYVQEDSTITTDDSGTFIGTALGATSMYVSKSGTIPMFRKEYSVTTEAEFMKAIKDINTLPNGTDDIGIKINLMNSITLTEEVTISNQNVHLNIEADESKRGMVENKIDNVDFPLHELFLTVTKHFRVIGRVEINHVTIRTPYTVDVGPRFSAFKAFIAFNNTTFDGCDPKRLLYAEQSRVHFASNCILYGQRFRGSNAIYTENVIMADDHSTISMEGVKLLGFNSTGILVANNYSFIYAPKCVIGSAHKEGETLQSAYNQNTEVKTNYPQTHYPLPYDETVPKPASVTAINNSSINMVRSTMDISQVGPTHPIQVTDYSRILLNSSTLKVNGIYGCMLSAINYSDINIMNSSIKQGTQKVTNVNTVVAGQTAIQAVNHSSIQGVSDIFTDNKHVPFRVLLADLGSFINISGNGSQVHLSTQTENHITCAHKSHIYMNSMYFGINGKTDGETVHFRTEVYSDSWLEYSSTSFQFFYPGSLTSNGQIHITMTNQGKVLISGNKNNATLVSNLPNETMSYAGIISYTNLHD